MTTRGTRTLLVAVGRLRGRGRGRFSSPPRHGAGRLRARRRPLALAGLGLCDRGLRGLGRLLDAGPAGGAAGRADPGGGQGPPGATRPASFPCSATAGVGLDQAALAFERTAAALVEERARLAAKVTELTAANARAGRGAGLPGPLREAGHRRPARRRGGPRGRQPARRRLRLRGAGARAPAARRRPPGQRRARPDRRRGGPDRPHRPRPARLRPPDAARGPARCRSGSAVDAARPASPRVQSRFKEVEVVVDLPADLPPVLADERHLSQVFLNLLLNAGDAMAGAGAGGGRRETAGPTQVELTVLGHRPGHRRRGPPPHLRPVLHHQGAGAGERARARHLPLHRRVDGRDHRRRRAATRTAAPPSSFGSGPRARLAPWPSRTSSSSTTKSRCATCSP